MFGVCDDLCIIIRDIKFFFITFQFLAAKFRLACLHLCDPFVTDHNRCQIRVREIAVVLGIFLGTHGKGTFFVVIPSSCLLNDLSARLDQLDLTLSFAFDRMSDGFEGIQVLHLGSGAKLFCSDFVHG